MTHRPRIAREQRTITAMLRIYCRDHHRAAPELCDDCAKLLDYAQRRLDTCPFQERKPACNHCEVHCYSKVMRERVKQVMRYAGPRMLLRHPVLAVRHLIDTWNKTAPRLG
ncbi:MAG: nitrous oxide-stimulated promoter family protein [Gammaproteobacteria bacterium]